MNVINLSPTILHDAKHKSRIYHHVQIWLFPDKVTVRGYYRGTLYPLFQVQTLVEGFECARRVQRKHPDISLRGPGVSL